MKEKIIFSFGCILLLIIGVFVSIHTLIKEPKIKSQKITARVLEVNNKKLTVQDKKNIIYTFHTSDLEVNADVGDNVVIEYMGLIDKNKSVQNSSSVINYKTVEAVTNDDGVPTAWLDNGIFSDYYILANRKLQELSLDEKIGQLLLVRYPDTNAVSDLKKYNFAGFVFFEKDFKDKDRDEVKKWINNLQKESKIPLLTAVDEEGGKVVRVSSNPKLVSEKFKSSQELYREGGLSLIKEDTINKSKILNDLGLNLNLAPVVDVSTNSSDYMYERALGQNTAITSDYAKTVIEASKNTGVSYTLKHFPGYGNNADTHTGSSEDNRSYDDIVEYDLPPFESGIESGAEAILVSHNIVKSIDPNLPASLSVNVHNLLRNELDFTGLIMTDDLSMGALSSISNPTVKAILAGNDLIITTDYAESFHEIKSAVEDGTISQDLIDKLAFRVLAWKYYKGLMFEKIK